jgi:hypothetical protein
MNEPAFPQTEPPHPSDIGGPVHWPGMSLRDYFAAKSLISISGLWKGNIGDFDNQAADRTARAAYRMADAMLAARTPQDTIGASNG